MRAASIAALLLVVGCSKNEWVKPEAEAGAKADASTSVSTSTAPSIDAKNVVVNGCLSCHSEHMLAQQRLTQAQWQKVVTKMVGWGANVEPTEVTPLVAYLTENYGPDAGAYTADPIGAADAGAELAVLPDDPLPAGDAERGKPIYGDKCAGCHGADARGATGVLLIDRPFLYRAADFAKTVRKGRGKMLPIALGDPEIADVLAHLRRLKNAGP